MKITLVTDKPVVTSTPRIQQSRKPAIGGRINQGVRSNRPKNGFNNNRTGGGGGGKPQNKKQAAPTKEQLDADLDAYVNKVNLKSNFFYNS